MNQTIFLPSDDETRQLMEHAWQEFQQQAGTQGGGGNEDHKRIKRIRLWQKKRNNHAAASRSRQGARINNLKGIR